MDISHVQAILIAWTGIITLAIILGGRVIIVAIQQYRLIQKALDNHAEHINVIEHTVVPNITQALGEPAKVGNGHASSSNPPVTGSSSDNLPGS